MWEDDECDARPLTIRDLAVDTARLSLIEADSIAQGLAVRDLIGVGGNSLVFAVQTEEHGRCALKIPWISLVSPGDGPHVCRQESGPTGPFTLQGAQRLDDAARLLHGAVQRMIKRGSAPPLPRLIAAPELGGMTCALMERVEGSTLRDIPLGDPVEFELLGALAESVARLHDVFGPHGDLKPEHIVRSASGNIVLLDPLPENAGWMGTMGFCLALPCNEVRDLFALAEIIARRWNTTLNSSLLEFRLINRANGRFGVGWETEREALRQRTPGRLAALPATLREWILAVVEHALARIGTHDATSAPQPVGWSKRMLDELSVAASDAGGPARA